MYKIDMISIKKKKCRKTRKLLKGGGNNIPKKMTNKRNFLIDIRQILVTKPIMEAARELSLEKVFFDDVIAPQFMIQKGEQGFRLGRLNVFRNKDPSNLHNILNSEPIEISPIEGRGRKLDGVMKQVFEVINGRHRLSLAISLNMKEVNVRIV